MFTCICCSYEYESIVCFLMHGYRFKYTFFFTFLTLFSDSVNVMRLQEQLREAQRKLDKERSAKTSLENKRKSLEKEKSELISKLEEVTRGKSHLEQSKIDSEAQFRNLQ